MDIIMYLYLAILFVALYIFTQHALHKLQNLPPTPFPALPLIGHYYLLKKPFHKTLFKLFEKYGPVYYLRYGSRPTVVASSAAAAEECFTKNDIIFANRPHLLFGKHIGYNYTSIVWSPYCDYWRNLRRICALEILSAHRLQKLSQIRADEVRTLIRHFYRESKANGDDQPVAVKPRFFEVMFNVITRMISGKRYYGETAEKSEEAKRFQEIMIETARLAATSNMGDYMPILRWFLLRGLEDRFVALCKRRDEFMQELIEEFREGRSGSATDEVSSSSSRKGDKTLIEILLDMHEAEPDNYTDEDIRSLMLTLLQAGVSTSVDTMEWALALLLNNPEALLKAQNEIDNVVGKDRLIEESDVPDLPYLRCIINETLRMYPVPRFLIPHESSEECTIGGYRIPRGTMLLVNLKAIQNDPKIWKDPEMFRPERFEGAKVGFAYMPFGSGRRKCPGEGLAIRVVVLSIGSLIQCFDWNRVGKEMVDMTESDGLFAPKVEGLMAKCRARPSMVELLSQI